MKLEPIGVDDLGPIGVDDLAACVEVFYAAEDELYGRLNQAPLPRNPEALRRLFSHILGSDPDRSWLARADGEVKGFGMAVGRDDLAFLSFLFVRPGHQRSGLGRRLLERCLPSRGYRATCVEAIQPVSTALYAGHGLVPRVPIYTFVGQPRDELPRLAGGHSLEPIVALAARDHAALAGDVDQLDLEVLGIRRAEDHRALYGWGRVGFLLRDEQGQAAGYGYAHSSGRVGPVVARDEALLLPLVGELLTQVTAIDAWQILVPGPAAETFAALLGAGLRLEGPPAVFCATQAGVDHRRYLPFTFALP